MELTPQLKKIIYIGLGLVLIIAIATAAYFAYKSGWFTGKLSPREKEKSHEEIIKDLTAPENAVPSVDEKIINDLTAPVSAENNTPSEPLPDTMKSLSAPVQ